MCTISVEYLFIVLSDLAYHTGKCSILFPNLSVSAVFGEKSQSICFERMISRNEF